MDRYPDILHEAGYFPTKGNNANRDFITLVPRERNCTVMYLDPPVFKVWSRQISIVLQPVEHLIKSCRTLKCT